MKKRIMVIDVMPLLYKGHFAFLNKPRMTSTGMNTSAIFVFTNIIRELVTDYEATHVVLVMDSSPTFRHDKYPEYKAQRDKLPEDISASIPLTKEFADAMNIYYLRVDKYEADDLMGTVSRMVSSNDDAEVWLISPDKDIAQLVNDKTLLVRPGKGNQQYEFYDKNKVCEEWGVKEPLQMIDYLGMAGDSADNIPGIAGVGPKMATKLLAEYGTLENVIANADNLAGKLSEKVKNSIEAARLSRWLAEIKCDVPISETLDDFLCKSPDFDKLEIFCKKYELSSLYQKICGKKINQDTDQNSNENSMSEIIEFDTIKNVPHKYVNCDTKEKIKKLANELSKTKLFTFDTETTGLDPMNDKIVGMSFCFKEHEAYYIPIIWPEKNLHTENGDNGGKETQSMLFGFEEEVSEEKNEFTLNYIKELLSPVFENENIKKTGHNIKFDLHVLNTIGIKVKGEISDSILAHCVIDSSSRHGMDPLAREYLKYDPVHISSLIGERGKNQITMDKVELSKIGDYAAEDADVSFMLHSILLEKVKEIGALEAFENCENKLVKVLFEMEEEGIKIDTNALSIYSDELTKEISEIEKKIYNHVGHSFNIASPQQLATVLFDEIKLPPSGKTSTGSYSTGEEVLNGLQGMHPIVSDIIEYRACTKLKSTYVDKLPKCINSRTGRVHTSFNQALTETGRLSSDNPNLQNIPIRTPRGKRIREAFIARDDNHVLMAADYSQVELRVMASLSGDESLIEAFNNDADIHQATASRVYGVSFDEVTKEMRSRSKMVNFGIIYGISAFGLAQRLGINRTNAAELIKTYFEMYPGVKQYIDKTIEEARANGYVKTLLGRRRVIRDINSRNATLRTAAERIAINTPVQGTAADLIKLAMISVYENLKKNNLRSKLILQVHDELVLDVYKPEVEEVRKIVEDCMTHAMNLKVPLKVDIGVGENWLVAH